VQRGWTTETNPCLIRGFVSEGIVLWRSLAHIVRSTAEFFSFFQCAFFGLFLRGFLTQNEARTHPGWTQGGPRANPGPIQDRFKPFR
jgi:hypothetical protein